jgi:hypothetical protein
MSDSSSSARREEVVAIRVAAERCRSIWSKAATADATTRANKSEDCCIHPECRVLFVPTNNNASMKVSAGIRYELANDCHQWNDEEYARAIMQIKGVEWLDVGN